ncbi:MULTISPECIES: cytochrome P450 [unclassified Streptomyces]|uniref:cytochrome P450 n=1 Tax=unclassified Streptomyces TaxID=2593676 RepID=UPI001BB07BF5|nr:MULTISPECIES: cytochrome P450 [unclassified Streptomyces]MDH6453973.1 cytochrome P450 [Streptomyces sp. SAI-119]MDH6495466.1 cytochrome P450 [Streptomyces sp. SAI-149]QUC57607.1 cytochrome P450 [Streptomyces sp. A2-16]GLP66953.1 cytochrome P450 [Streptomyces sp. TUS-ST3]
MQPHHDTSPEIPPGCPAHGNVPLYGPQFASDIEGTYEYLRSLGPIAPVDIAPGVEVELVTSYDTALKILQDSTTFVRDSRRWNALNEGRVPQDSPALPMMGYRPNALFADGSRHARLRQPVTESLATINELQLVRQVQQSAGYLISRFGARGQADLMADYAGPLPLLVFSDQFGCPPEIGDRVIVGISGIFEGTPGADEILVAALMELIALKRQSPGADLTTRLMVHPAQLTDEEVLHQLVTLLSGGTAPLAAAIGTATALYLSEDWPQGRSVEDAVAQTLWSYPPIANYAGHYPTHDVEVDGKTLRAGDPVLISFAAANTDPRLDVHREQLSSKAHLAFGAGPHACPAKDPAVMIVVAAVEALLNRLPDVETRIAFKSLAWSESPWSRSLVTVPIRFTPPSAPSAASTAPKAAETVRPSVAPVAPAASRPAHAAPAKGLFSRFLAWTRGE